eukprot:3851803-Amphidinium_carterae.1
MLFVFRVVTFKRLVHKRARWQDEKRMPSQLIELLEDMKTIQVWIAPLISGWNAQTTRAYRSNEALFRLTFKPIVTNAQVLLCKLDCFPEEYNMLDLLTLQLDLVAREVEAMP